MTSAKTKPAPLYDHLARMSDARGLFEHALYSTPRPEHGYCVDDVARGLVVVCREPQPTPVLKRLERCYLDFVLGAAEADGSCHNRMNADGTWSDTAGLGDWWGRALWGLGVATTHARTSGMRARALGGFRILAQQRAPHVRAMAFAALGAAEVRTTRPDERCAQQLLADAVHAVCPGELDPVWPWPEARLSYGNGTLAEAVIVAGASLGHAQIINRGLAMLGFLLRTETSAGHLSVTPVAGRGPRDLKPGFDQQPIEVAALADACAAAYRVSEDPRWLTGIRMSWDWFLGDNDSSTPMFDTATGAGFDGLESGGCNQNQGAESTLAMLSTAQHARSISQLR
jgi:hypothetical protein